MRNRIVTVDILTRKFESVFYKQYDSNNELNIVVYEGKTLADISNYAANVYFKLPSGKVYEVEGTIKNSIIKVILSSSILEECGRVNVECELFKLDEIVTTFTFYLYVEESIKRVGTLNPDSQQTQQIHHIHSNLDVLNQITQEMVDSIGLSGGLVDLSIYQTKRDTTLETDNKTVSGAINELNKKIENTSENIDLSDYALKSEIPTRVSQLQNDSNFISSIPEEYVTEQELAAKGLATETFVTNKIAEASLSGGEVDLSGYATKDELKTKANVNHTHMMSDITDLVIPDVDKAYVDTQLNTKANKSDIPNLDGYALKTDIPTVPTKTSQLTNDSGFITSIPSEYVTESELNAKGYLTEHQDISGKVDKSYVDTELAKKSDKTHTHSYNDLSDKPTIPSVDGLATKKELTDGLATKSDTTHTHDQYLTEHQDLSNYALKTELPTVPTKVSQLQNDKGYITEIPSEYITETELSAKGYLTEHQDISGKVDKINGKGLSTNDYTTEEKNKLNRIEENANNYSLPIASSTVLGGIKIGSGLSIDSNGVLSSNVPSLEGNALTFGNYTIKYNETDDTLDFIYNGTTEEPEVPPTTGDYVTEGLSLYIDAADVATQGSIRDITGKQNITNHGVSTTLDNGCLNFVANESDYIDTGLVPNLTTWSAEVYFYFTETPTTTQIAISWGGSGNGARIGFRDIEEAFIVRLNSNVNYTVADISNFTSLCHLIITMNNGTVTSYFNGVKTVLGSDANGVQTSQAATLKIGTKYDIEQFTNMNLKSFRFYNGKVLSDEEALQNYNYEINRG